MFGHFLARRAVPCIWQRFLCPGNLLVAPGSRDQGLRGHVVRSRTNIRWNHGHGPTKGPSKPIPALRKGTWTLPDPKELVQKSVGAGSDGIQGSLASVDQDDQTQHRPNGRVSDIPEDKPNDTKNSKTSAEARGLAQGVLFMADQVNVPPKWRTRKDLSPWRRHQFAMREKLAGQPWRPSKKLSRQDIETVRYLKDTYPNMNASELSEMFQVSPEAIRRILKSKWRPTENDMEVLSRRWQARGEKIRAMRRKDADKNVTKDKNNNVKRAKTKKRRKGDGGGIVDLGNVPL